MGGKYSCIVRGKEFRNKQKLYFKIKAVVGLLDTLRKTTKYHPETPVIQERLLINWVSCYAFLWAIVE
jgi:hypothetical protein